MIDIPTTKIRKNSRKFKDDLKKLSGIDIEFNSEISGEEVLKLHKLKYETVELYEYETEYVMSFFTHNKKKKILIPKSEERKIELMGLIEEKLKEIKKAKKLAEDKKIIVEDYVCDFQIAKLPKVDALDFLRIDEKNNKISLINRQYFLKNEIEKRDYLDELKKYCLSNSIDFGKLEQQNEHWHKLRAGVITATNAKELHAYDHEDDNPLFLQKMTEKLYGVDDLATATSSSMEWGNEHEDEAFKFFLDKNFILEKDSFKIPFVFHSKLEYAGCSPDGLYIEDGQVHAVEIKCPFNPKNHVKTLMTKEVPKQYIYQLNWQMICLGLTKIKFLSFDPRIKNKEHKLIEIDYEINQEIAHKLLKNYELLIKKMEYKIWEI